MCRKEAPGMKVDVLYDVFCDKCGRSLSKDYASGLFISAGTAEKEAKRLGFFEIGGKRICPACAEKLSLKRVPKKTHAASSRA